MTDDILKSLVMRLESLFLTKVKESDGVYTLSLPKDEIILFTEGDEVVMEIVEIGDGDLIVDEFRITPSDNRWVKEKEFEGLMKATKALAFA